ncbi:hypothetical protein G7Z17_g17 [Cylindrodendrum hubeiense]|uniref:SnoaL-like domain-containing protein n=1 Tax=Cylindrodendrum hubeiense TaxID=595255 RepID=A0A9P5LDN3_9HYPO|nr:hypothetical protein G7Z17_g17 [Cylindrodendrum hubeiense]
MAPSQEAMEIITRKKQQYCRFADSNQWHEFDNIMMPDFTAEFFNAEGEIHVENNTEYRFASLEEWRGYFSKAFEQLQTIHIVSPAEFEEVSPDEIKAIFTVLYHAGTKSDTGMHGTGGGHYHEIWKRKGDDWFMQSMKMNRLYWKVLA